MKKNIKQDETGEILQYIVKNMATKDDLQNFATKDDLQNFATKDDFKDLSGKVDLIYNILDKDASYREKDEMERASLSMQVDRHESWIHSIAQKTNVELVNP